MDAVEVGEVGEVDEVPQGQARHVAQVQRGFHG
ncbi:predicted protein [Streptomyces iranensis]|uniref:Uncharacterized protein n=1 Tax=Streptomyces iranensis TaxID=576784 RepID=A0A060ZNI3_9ACTN|nr:predicted protein [Streptomyces iranensis]